jgi:hypothetical protein
LPRDGTARGATGAAVAVGLGVSVGAGVAVGDDEEQAASSGRSKAQMARVLALDVGGVFNSGLPFTEWRKSHEGQLQG